MAGRIRLKEPVPRCMTPRAWADAATLKRRRDAYECHEGSTHWPHEFSGNSAALPDFQPSDPAAATPLVRALVGFPAAQLEQQRRRCAVQ